MPSVCLISPGHLASNPRLVKEADALHEAGYQVRVIAGDYMEAIRPLDGTILARAGWRCERVSPESFIGYLGRSLRQRSAQALTAYGYVPGLSIAVWANNKVTDRLTTAALKEPADLYIAHYLPALPAAAAAAQRYGAKLGFDAEDFHTGELPDSSEHLAEISVRDRIERTLLPRCEHLTAASPGIAHAYFSRYGIKMEPVLNVFPLSEVPDRREGGGMDRRGTEPSLYWFSQTIGPGRGLEFIVRAMGRMHTPVSLHLRGIPATGYIETLKQLANDAGVLNQVHLLPIAAPSEMARLAASHDVGLSLEPGRDQNNKICLGNKIFIYLLAGLPMLLSDTPSQREFQAELGEAALLVDIEDVDCLAVSLDNLFSDPNKLSQARKKAWQLGRERYNWDIEKRRFLSLVGRILTSQAIHCSTYSI